MTDAVVASNGPGPGTVPGPTLEARGVVVAFGGVVALGGVDFALEAGEVRGLIGPNGAGKTTLFDVLAGVRAPSQGRVLLEGRNVTRRSPTWRARHGVRRTFQRQQLFGWLSAEDNVLVPLEWRRGGGGLPADLLRWPGRAALERRRRAQVADVLDRVGIADLASAPASLLPVGQARLVEVARATVDRPKVLLLDEPTSGLEEHEVEALAALVRALARVDRVAVGLVEHHMGFVMGLCDEVTVLNLGSVLAVGTPAEVQSDPAVAAAYLG